MKKETAQKLIELIQAIDTDNPSENNFVDVVCGKFIELPESVIEELKDIAGQANYGCHVDLEKDMVPDACVIGTDQSWSCGYAERLVREGKTKIDCKYWQPITFNAGVK